MLLAGVEVRRELVDWVRLRVGEPTASVLQEALDDDRSVVALDIEHRIGLAAALTECPDELLELRETLLRDLDAYRRAGLL